MRPPGSGARSPTQDHRRTARRSAKACRDDRPGRVRERTGTARETRDARVGQTTAAQHFGLLEIQTEQIATVVTHLLILTQVRASSLESRGWYSYYSAPPLVGWSTSESKARPMLPLAKREILNRLKTVRGHMDGIIRMSDEEAYCVDLMKQVSAAQASLERVNRLILKNHLETCFSEAVTAGRAQPAIAELLDAIKFNAVLTGAEASLGGAASGEPAAERKAAD